MEKITFYGKDFSPLADAEYRLDGPKQKLTEDDPYLELLKHFCDSYEPDEKHKGIPLRFPKNRGLFNKYIGVFRRKEFPFGGETYDVTLEISCRFDKGKNAFFLAAMLLCLEPEKLRNPNEVSITTFHQVMDIFLLFMYKKQLAEAAKKGGFRKYQRFENNDSRPHGTVDIARHIRENMGLKSGRIAYHYRELTGNNPVNRLVLAAYKRLCEKYPTLCEERINRDESVYSTLRMLQTELGYSKTNVRNIVKENLRPVTHPYFSEYEDLRKTCLKILRDENVWIFDAEDAEETESLSMNVTELWEQFVEYCLRKQLKKQEDLTAQDKKPLFAGKYANPDFVFSREQRPQAILDAKFKPHWGMFFSSVAGEPITTTDDDSKYSRTTIDADINKCIRDMVVFQTGRTGVIFPEESGGNGPRNDPDKNHIARQIGDSDRKFDMVRVPIPSGEGAASFDDWYHKLLEHVDGVLKLYLEKITGT